MNIIPNEAFWETLERLVKESEIVIDRPKGSAHPRFPHIIYDADYGYLKNTSSPDGAGIDVWVGSLDNGEITAVICTVDIMKKDSEIKILIGCTEEETEKIYTFHNGSPYMKGLLIKADGRL